MDKQKLEQKKSRIMEAALQVFVKHGFSNARMDDIVEKSGMSKGAIYYHYKSKKDLFLELIDHWETHTFPEFYTKSEPERTASDTLRGFALEVADIFENRKYVFLAEIEFWALANRDKDVRDRSRQLYAKILTLFEKVLNKGIRAGEFNGINTKMAAFTIMTGLQGVNWFSIFTSNDFSAREYLVEVMEFMIRGFNLQPKPAA